MEKTINKNKLIGILPVIITIIGMSLLIYMIKVEDEPGALPLFLIIIGIVWFIINRYKQKTH